MITAVKFVFLIVAYFYFVSIVGKAMRIEDDDE